MSDADGPNASPEGDVNASKIPEDLEKWGRDWIGNLILIEGGACVALNFDRLSYEALQGIVRAGTFQSVDEAIREALRILEALQKQAKEGFTEIVVRHGGSGRERRLLTQVVRSEPQFAESGKRGRRIRE